MLTQVLMCDKSLTLQAPPASPIGAFLMRHEKDGVSLKLTLANVLACHQHLAYTVPRVGFENGDIKTYCSYSQYLLKSSSLKDTLQRNQVKNKSKGFRHTLESH